MYGKQSDYKAEFSFEFLGCAPLLSVITHEVYDMPYMLFCKGLMEQNDMRGDFLISSSVLFSKQCE
jgi:hypothetical protein